ncbi:NADH-quinone oxidoreductase subunit J [Dankookia rubra]|uniref:NADH-quinone oxidoreductase subunit J n=1 Tax=Dankookia rubra TaxID=1442381 RepID=A0A4V3A9U7_9PROT|nr:proton-conducting transporter membrane subunit [Dankookia rubra]TDH60575.1 NADH-quinone oxidoreductase subunit J [Dankookia rubra]
MSGTGLLLPLAIGLPLLGALLAPLLPGRFAARFASLVCLLGNLAAVAIELAVYRGGTPLLQPIGGLLLRADGLAAAMLGTSAMVTGAVGLYARADHGDAPAFWSLLLGVWAAMALVLLGTDLFSLAIALELLTFASVPLVCLDGRPGTVAAALRSLLFGLLGSALILLGCALLLGRTGTLDIQALAGLTRAEPATLLACALMTAGLLAKTALFPLHLWLPAAHGGASAAVSALLSALVVKAAFVVLLRLWFGAAPALLPAVAPLLAGLGGAAILVGSLVAVRQARLKLLVAYSTVAQLGYLFLAFPLVVATTPALGAFAWTGAVLQAVSHAFAKAAMAMAAGLLAAAHGHDRLDALGGAARAMPVTVIAFGLAGLSLMGMPPSGGFTAKWLLLRAAVESGQWWWSLVIVTGGLLTGGYVYRVLAAVQAPAEGGPAARPPGARGQEAIAMTLALISVVLGLVPLGSFGLVQIGRLGSAP